jgi:hypothetical protein
LLGGLIAVAVGTIGRERVLEQGAARRVDER